MGVITARDLTTVIVNWNTPDLTLRAAESALAGTPDGVDHEVVVVDNASHDGSAERIETAGLRLTLLRNEENRGFAAANNQVMAQSPSRLVLLLNSDAYLEPGALERMIERVDASPRSAAVGCRLVYESGRFQRWTAGADPSLGSVALYLLGLDRLGSLESSGLYLGRDIGTARQVGWVSAACMLLDRRAALDAGGMDERYFYMEDVDLCRRLRMLGREIWYEPAATAVHVMGESVSQAGSSATGHSVRSLNRYFAEQNAAPAYLALRMLEIGAFGGRALAHAARAVAGSDRARHAAEARSHLSRSLRGGPMLRRGVAADAPRLTLGAVGGTNTGVGP